MGKINVRVHRKDGLQDHIHSLPDGKLTGGSLFKSQVNSNPINGWHTHLYQCEGRTLETGPAHEGPGHVHSSEYGETSGPSPIRKDSFEEPTIQRRGSTWHKVGYAGHSLGQFRNDAAEDLTNWGAHGDMFDQFMLSRADVDEALWNKAKRASQEAFGKIKWPFVNWWYGEHGGS